MEEEAAVVEAEPSLPRISTSYYSIPRTAEKQRRTDEGNGSHKIEGCKELEGLPNVRPAVAADLRPLGIKSPKQLRGRDPYKPYEKLCRVTDKRDDFCMLDTFISILRFADGGPAKPWWHYTTERMQMLARITGRRGVNSKSTCDRVRQFRVLGR